MKNTLSNYFPQFVYGGIDGLITTYAIVTAALGANLPPKTIFILGFASVLADAFSMGSSSYLSSKSEKETSNKSPLKKAIATFLSFVAVGCIPLIPFFIGIFNNLATKKLIISSIILTALSFFFIGLLRGKILNKPYLKSALLIFTIGALASLISWLVAVSLNGLH